MAIFLCITLNPAIDTTLALAQLQIGAVNRVQSAHSRPAGKGLNVASVLNALGHDVWVTGFLGENNRAMFDDDFAKQGFHNAFVYVAGETRQNIKIAETANGQMTDINGQGFWVDAHAKQQLFERIAELASQVDIIAMSGSLPQNFSPVDFDALIKLISQYNKKLAIDSSGEALKVAVANQPFLLKPNNDELSESFGMPAETFDEQKKLLATLNSNTEHWVISLGEKGVNWLTANQNLHAMPPRVAVKSTVGAGDTLLAGVLHGIASDLPMSTTLTLATALASHTVSQIGCELPDATRFDSLQQGVTITPL